MPLLSAINRLRKLVYIAGILWIAMYAVGCKKAYIEFGEQYVDAGVTNIVVVDTITPVLSTVFRDSIVTSQSGKIIVGSYNDNLFGKISSSSFLVLSSPSSVPDFHISAGYDSLVFQMRSDSSFYGDTTIPQRFNVNQLSQMIDFPEDQTQLYDKSDFPVYPTALGSADVVIRPSLKDSVKIRLSDVKGQEIWGLLQSKAQQVLTATDFEHYFNGLKVSPDNPSSNAAIYGFSDSVTVRLYYHESNPYLVQKQIDFVLTSRNKEFNQIKHNRSGTALNVTIPESREVPASLTGHTAFVQPITGVLMKMTFPTLRSLLQRNDYVRIMRADLIIPPLHGSYSFNYMLPPQMQISATNVNNGLGGVIGVGGVGSQSPQYGNLVTDWTYGENTMYTYDLTAYMQQQITVSADNTNGLIFLPPSPAYNTKFNRLVTGDSENATGNVKLKIYYISVQQQ